MNPGFADHISSEFAAQEINLDLLSLHITPLPNRFGVLSWFLELHVTNVYLNAYTKSYTLSLFKQYILIAAELVSSKTVRASETFCFLFPG